MIFGLIIHGLVERHNKNNPYDNGDLLTNLDSCYSQTFSEVSRK